MLGGEASDPIRRPSAHLDRGMNISGTCTNGSSVRPKSRHQDFGERNDAYVQGTVTLQSVGKSPGRDVTRSGGMNQGPETRTSLPALVLFGT